MGKLQPCSYNKLLLKLFLLLLLPILVYGECTCEALKSEARNKLLYCFCDQEDGDRNKSEALKYKLVAISSILVAGAIGVCLPLMGKKIPALSPEKNVFFLIKAFAAGVILSTGFIHVLADASEGLTSPCLSEKPWGEFPFANFVAMCSAIGTLMVDAFATSFFNKRNSNKALPASGDEEQVHVHTHTTHGHSHGSTAFTDDFASSELLRHRVISQVLELGIVVHSVIIGIALGASESPKTIKPLVAALTFHQFFEGMGLGGCIAQAKFRSRANAIMVLFFSLTTPVGIAIGIGISNIYDENSPNALIVEGIFNAASAGILIYMALVDLLAADFMSPKIQNNRRLWIGACVSLLIGTGCMSLLAKWA